MIVIAFRNNTFMLCVKFSSTMFLYKLMVHNLKSVNIEFNIHC